MDSNRQNTPENTELEGRGEKEGWGEKKMPWIETSGAEDLCAMKVNCYILDYSLIEKSTLRNKFQIGLTGLIQLVLVYSIYIKN